MADIMDLFPDRVMPIPMAGCWIWTGSDDGRVGYGKVRVKGKLWYAHRFSWALTNGPIPEGVQVNHQCDVYECVNPDHLDIGDQFDNMHECAARNRIAVGSRNGQAALTEELIPTIRKDARPSRVVGKQYGVDSKTVRDIRNRITWRHVP